MKQQPEAADSAAAADGELQAKALDLVGQGRRQRLLFDPAGYEEAVPLLREAIELVPTLAEAYAELSQTYSCWGFRREICGEECQRLYDMALEYAEVGLRLAPESAAAHLAVAVALRRGAKADPERRRQEIATALDLAPGDAEALYERWRAEGYEPASPLLGRIMDAAPDFLAVHIDLGAVHAELGRLDEALREFQKAAELNPRNTQAYYDIAMVLDRKGLAGKAAALLRKIQGMAPDDALIAQGLALLEGGS